ncbi:MAG: TatD family hydrolase [Candidatus Thiodiazotropha sp. (ex Lucinoma borealis)]|nr:TatD family hydrolase [Candidatus Thiodiazotropha sp. (ex Lucinoma borealis)]
MHCHLDLYPDPFDVAKLCDEKGLYVLSVTTTPKAWDGTKKLATGYKRIQTALGLHPQLAHQRSDELELFDHLLPDAKYVGEIGLDGGKGYKEHWEVQLKVFRHILKQVNHSGGRIMTIHSRASAGQTLDELEGVEGVPVLHWFTGTKSELKRALSMGCWFSIGPAMSETKRGKELVSIIPKDRVLIETDGPFAKLKGLPLMPWEADQASHSLSKIWGNSLIEVNEILICNLKALLAHNNSC